MSEMDGAEKGQLALDAALHQVETNADQTWFNSALEAVRRVSTRLKAFTTDHVWKVLVEEMKAGAPREPRALGAVMRRAMVLGYCNGTNTTMKSTRPECHRRPIMVYRSKLAPS